MPNQSYIHIGEVVAVGLFNINDLKKTLQIVIYKLYKHINIYIYIYINIFEKIGL